MTTGGVRSHTAVHPNGRAGTARYTAEVPRPRAWAAMATADSTDARLALRTERAAAAYRAHYDLLRFVAGRKFRVPSEDVRPLVHDVFVAFLRNEAKIGQTAEDERSWLVGATCNACRYYWRKHGGAGSPPATVDAPIDPLAVVEEAAQRLLLAGVLRRLPERCRELLVRRYGEGYTPDEIASWQSLTHGSAKNLISKCLLAARAAFRRLVGRPR
jgi:RNA polymerase sigma factor (sigma-70 family)